MNIKTGLYLRVSLLLLAGSVFKFWFARLNPQPFVYDQWQYFNYAVQMIANGFHADPSRLYGFPFLIIPLVRFFGDAQIPFTIFNTVMDTVTGLLVFLIARRTIGGRTPWIALVLYMFNPFTAGYVGVLLTEIPAIFFVTLLGYLTVLASKSKQAIVFPVTGLVAGFLPQIRPGYSYFSGMVLVYLCFLIVRRLKPVRVKAVALAGSIMLFILPFSYNVAANMKIYRQFSVQSVDDAFWREAYLSIVVGKALPTGDGRLWQWPTEAHNVWIEYSSPTTPTGRREMSAKYKNIVLGIFRKDPAGFVLSHIIRMKNAWEKNYVYPYWVVPEKPFVAITYWGNIVLLGLGLGGLIIGMSEIRKKDTLRTLLLYSAMLILYMNFTHIFTTGEERFTLPAYPLIILWTGYALGKIYDLRFRI